MYKFYYSGNKVICVSSFAGRTIRGVAKCSPNDQFNKEIGERLAQARCDQKVATARMKYAEKTLDKADDAFYKASKEYDFACDYYDRAVDELADANAVLEDILDEV